VTDRILIPRTALPALLWFLLIMVLLSLPGKSFPVVQFWKPDKLAHIGLFGMQALLLWIALAFRYGTTSGASRVLTITIVACVLFAGLSELYQDIFTSRLADPYDVVANCIGILLAVIFIMIIRPQRLIRLSRKLLRIPSEM
jgi:VanZ family protein